MRSTGMNVGWVHVDKLVLSSGKFALSALLALWVCADIAAAATLGEATAPAGQPIHQQFLASGASVITTADARACVVSQRIGIETSTYRNPDGTLTPFVQITRSIAASVQAVAVLGTGATEKTAEGTGFRIQLKYSPAPGTPILLRLGDVQTDLQAMLEPSTDSLWISGATAVALTAAFDAAVPVQIVAQSGDTARQVTDTLVAPDLAALAACAATGAATGAEAGAAASLPRPDVLTNEIRVSFHADPVSTPLASLPELTACGMIDVPGELHLARLETVTGFFAQTDKVFVSFDDAGAVAQIYIPGILDGDFRGDTNTVRLSLAADSNVPAQQNAVKGCLGAKTVPVCHYGLADGAQLLASCIGLPGSGDGSDYGSDDGPGETLASLFPSGNPGSGGSTSGGFTPGPGTGGPGKTVDGELPDTDGPDPDPVDPGPSPVPLPAPFLLLATAIFGLYRLRARRA